MKRNVAIAGAVLWTLFQLACVWYALTGATKGQHCSLCGCCRSCIKREQKIAYDITSYAEGEPAFKSDCVTTVHNNASTVHCTDGWATYTRQPDPVLLMSDYFGGDYIEIEYDRVLEHLVFRSQKSGTAVRLYAPNFDWQKSVVAEVRK